jgi:hypothetical protein
MMAPAALPKATFTRRASLRRHLVSAPSILSLETAAPFPQRWGLLRKGRAVFRREDRFFKKN